MTKLKVSGPEWWQLTPRWLDHQKMLNLLDGDESLLHGQERILRETTNGQVENWSKAFYMPTTADRFVGGFRQWLNRYGGKEVKWVEGVDPTLPPFIEKKEDLLDRYNSHTEHCAVCSKPWQISGLSGQYCSLLLDSWWVVLHCSMYGHTAFHSSWLQASVLSLLGGSR